MTRKKSRSKIEGLLSSPSCVELASVTTLSQFCSLNILRHHRDLFLIQLFNLIIMTLLFQTNTLCSTFFLTDDTIIYARKSLQALIYLNPLNLSLAAQNQHKCRKDLKIIFLKTFTSCANKINGSYKYFFLIACEKRTFEIHVQRGAQTLHRTEMLSFIFQLQYYCAVSLHNCPGL